MEGVAVNVTDAPAQIVEEAGLIETVGTGLTVMLCDWVAEQLPEPTV